MTLPHVPASLFRVQEIFFQQLPSLKLTTLCLRKSMVERWNFRFAFRPYFPGAFAVSFREGIYIQAKERCAFNCRFFRNVLNATGTAQGAGGCWWDGGKAADGGGSCGGKKGRAPPKPRIFRFWLVVYSTNPWFWTINQYKSTDPPSKNPQGAFTTNDRNCLPLLGGVPWNSIQNFSDGTHGKRHFFEEKTVVVPNLFTYTPFGRISLRDELGYPTLTENPMESRNPMEFFAGSVLQKGGG